MVAFFSKRNRKSLGFRLVLYILLCSSLVTLIITSLQIYYDYRVDLSLIEKRIEQIEKSNLASLSEALWVTNQDSLRLQLEGILRIQDMQYLQITEEGEIIVSVGTPQAENIVSRNFKLTHDYNDQRQEIGELKVIVSLSGVYQRLLNKVLVILGTQAIKTFIVSFFILFVFYLLVGKHIFSLAAQALGATQGLGSQTLFLNRLVLQGKGRPEKGRTEEAGDDGDELDQLVASFNAMTQKLRQSEARYRTIIETTTEGFTRYDLSKEKLVEVNQSLCDLLGYSKVEILEGFPMQFADAPNRKVLIQNRLSVEKHGKQIFEVCLMSKAGEPIIFRVSAATLEGPSGKPVGVYAFYSDITEIRKTEAELKRHRDHLEELVNEQTRELVRAKDIAEAANMAKSKFLSSMSHELRTPLNAILGFAQLLQIGGKKPLDEDQEVSVGHIIKGGDHLLDLINDVLDLAKIESGNLALSMESVSVPAIIAECLQLIAPLAEKAGIKVINGVEEDALPPVRSDNVRLKQALVNLLSNAIKYNREEGSVTITCKPLRSGKVEIAISDTGKGIAADQMEELFRPFARLGAENSGIEGTGIGLSLTRSLIQQMGGEIKVESQLEKGSTFSFQLNAFAEPAVPEVESMGKEAVERGTLIKCEKVLYVEDNPSNLELMENVFSQHSETQLISAKNGEQGISMAISESPDLIILDINLPGMDGFAVLKELRANKSTKGIPVIALSALAMPNDIERAIEAGFKAYLTKPLQIGKMIQTINKFCGSGN